MGHPGWPPKRCWVVAAALGLLLAPWPTAGQSRPAPLAETRRDVSLQGERFGILPDTHQVTIRARDVFEQITRAAGPRPDLVLEVRVLDTPRVIAESQRGGLVLISRGLVDLIGS